MRSYLCPVCGYGMEDEPANYHICPSCGTEFGLHDQNATVEDLRAAWIKTGPKWWSKTDPQPSNWDPLAQLEGVASPQPKPAKSANRIIFASYSQSNTGGAASGSATNSLKYEVLARTTTNVAAQILETSHR
jgi:hypothetical protein